MKILLSAYACEPNKGSEPGVGWDWANEIAKYHELWVLTRDNNQPTIEKYLHVHPEMENKKIHYVYIGLPRWKTFWKKGRRGMRLFYVMWQKEAYKKALILHKKIHFDIVHHVTFVSYTQPTYMYKLGIPMIWGPIAGGDNLPKALHIQMSYKEHIEEVIRSVSQKVLILAPSTINALRKSKVIITATEATKNSFPKKYRKKTIVMPAIGINKIEKNINQKSDERFRIITAGRLVYLKGYELAIEAFKKVAANNTNIDLYILGDGPLKQKLEKQSGAYLNKRIFFLEAVPHDKIFEFYKGFDLYLSTALRDSGCMTMLEAMSVSVPALCIASGGPKVLSHSMPDMQVETKSNSYVIEQLASCIEKLASNTDLLLEKQRETAKACEEFCLSNKMLVLNDIYQSIVF